MIDVPEVFARGTVEREGGAGAAWIAQLPGIVEELLARWECAPDGDVRHGGVGVIVPVRRRQGGSAALKVSFPRAEAHRGGRPAWGRAPRPGRVRRGRGGRPRTRAALGAVPRRPGRSLGPSPRIPRGSWRIGARTAHRVRGPHGGVAHGAHVKRDTAAGHDPRGHDRVTRPGAVRRAYRVQAAPDGRARARVPSAAPSRQREGRVIISRWAPVPRQARVVRPPPPACRG
jgi:hypothetical protein